LYTEKSVNALNLSKLLGILVLGNFLSVTLICSFFGLVDVLEWDFQPKRLVPFRIGDKSILMNGIRWRGRVFAPIGSSFGADLIVSIKMNVK